MRLMSNRPDVGIDEDVAPLRTAGVTPGPSLKRRGESVEQGG